MNIRRFFPDDIPFLEDILRANNQFAFPEVEGGAAMLRFAAQPGAVFLVAERDGRIAGFLRGIYDGARAVIHVLSIAPAQQRRGVGTALYQAAVKEFSVLGAPTVAATVIPESAGFWEKQGLEPLPARVWLRASLKSS